MHSAYLLLVLARKPLCGVFAFWLLSVAALIAQPAAEPDVLVVEHVRKLKRYRFELGDRIRLHWTGEPSDRVGTLVGLRPDTLLITDRNSERLWIIPLREIETIRPSGSLHTGRHLMRLAGTGAASLGAALLLITPINRSINSENPLVPVHTWGLCGGLIGGGLVLQALGGDRRLRLQRKQQRPPRWRAQTLDLGLDKPLPRSVER